MEAADVFQKFMAQFAEQQEVRNRTFETPTVRLTSAQVQTLLSDAIRRTEDRAKAVEAAHTEAQKVLSDAHRKGLHVTGRECLGPGQMAPEVEREALTQRLALYRFTAAHLAPDAVFELDALNAWTFFGATSGAPGSLVGYLR